MERLKERLMVTRRALGTLQEILVLESLSRVEQDAVLQRNVILSGAKNLSEKPFVSLRVMKQYINHLQSE